MVIVTALLLCLLCKVLHAVSSRAPILATITSPYQIHNNQTVKISQSEIVSLTIAFTKYHLHFAEGDSEVCLPNDASNRTMIALTRMVSLIKSVHFSTKIFIYFCLQVDRCVSSKYRPRELSRAQVSWKAKDPPSHGRNSTHSQQSNESNNQEVKQGVDSEKEVVHEYLLFALVLPNHPFSQSLLETLTTVAPMFPNVTTVIGNGYDFRDMTAKYFVHSFPKVLFFRMGLLTGALEEKVTPEGLAGEIAKWTSSLPRSLPLRLSSAFSKHEENTNAVGYKFYNVLQLFNFSISPSSYCSLNIPVPLHDMEPFLGSVVHYRFWSNIAFVTSGGFVLMKMWLFWKRRHL
jgi:hypothetical protein